MAQYGNICLSGGGGRGDDVNVILSKSDGKMGPLYRCSNDVKSDRFICVALLNGHGRFGNDVQTGRKESLGMRTWKMLYIKWFHIFTLSCLVIPVQLCLMLLAAILAADRWNLSGGKCLFATPSYRVSSGGNGRIKMAAAIEVNKDFWHFERRFCEFGNVSCYN